MKGDSQASDSTQKSPILCVSTFKSPCPGSRNVLRLYSTSATPGNATTPLQRDLPLPQTEVASESNHR